MIFNTGSSCYYKSNHTNICIASYFHLSPKKEGMDYLLFCDLYQNFEKWYHYKNTKRKHQNKF